MPLIIFSLLTRIYFSFLIDIDLYKDSKPRIYNKYLTYIPNIFPSFEQFLLQYIMQNLCPTIFG